MLGSDQDGTLEIERSFSVTLKLNSQNEKLNYHFTWMPFGSLHLIASVLQGRNWSRSRWKFEDDNSCGSAALLSHSRQHISYPSVAEGWMSSSEPQEFAPAHKETEVSEFLDGHSVEGCWMDAQRMLAKSGLDRPPKLPFVRSELITKVLATVLAVELL
jgi:hypothetical protein